MYFVILSVILTILVNSGQTCSSPEELINNENRCLETSTTFLQRVQHHATGLFTSAKRKLGIDPNARDEPLNCDYYLCIVQSIGMANNYGILELEVIGDWLSDNVPQKYNSEMIQYATLCVENIKNNTDETNCDRSLEYIKCLHNFEKCQIFKYP